MKRAAGSFWAERRGAPSRAIRLMVIRTPLESELKRCLRPIGELNSETWLILREDLRHTPHVRAFTDFVAAYVQSLRPQFAGVSGA